MKCKVVKCDELADEKGYCYRCYEHIKRDKSYLEMKKREENETRDKK